MIFCKTHSTPIFQTHEHTGVLADGITPGPTSLVEELVGWTEPAIVRTVNAVVNGVAKATHVLDCFTEVPLPDGTSLNVNCKYTADEMRANLAAATTTAPATVDANPGATITEDPNQANTDAAV